MWEYSVIFTHNAKNETWRHVDDHYFKWSCKLESYWKAMNLSNNDRRATFLGWNSVWIDRLDKSSELRQFVCLLGSVAPRQNQKDE
jgi:hypothetical protein